MIVERATARLTKAATGALLNTAPFLFVGYVLHTASMGQTRVSINDLERLFGAGSLFTRLFLSQGHKVQLNKRPKLDRALLKIEPKLTST